MAKINSHVHAAIAASTPGMTTGQKVFLRSAGFLWWGFKIARKIKLLSKKENLIPFTAGAALQAVAGNNPSMQQVSKFVFGSVSILRCSGVLMEVSQLSRLCIRLISGKEYVYVKKDDFNPPTIKKWVSPSLSDQVRWFKTVTWLRIQLIFKTIGEIFKRLGQLAWHIGDACTAFTENTVAEVFIHGRDLWRELTADESLLVKNLKKATPVNDFMLARMGSQNRTPAILRLFVKMRENLPVPQDMKKNYLQDIGNDADHIEAVVQMMHQGMYEELGGDKKDLVDQKYHLYVKGEPEDPHVNRYIEIKRPPIKQ